MFKFDSWKEIQMIEGASAVWQILAYPEIVDLNPSGSFDSSRIISSGVDMKEAMTAAVTPKDLLLYILFIPSRLFRFLLNGSSVLFEPGAMHFMKGNLEMSLDTPAGAGGMEGFSSVLRLQ